MSSGGAMCAAIKLAKTLEKGTIVTIVCDRGDRYLSSGIFSDGEHKLWSHAYNHSDKYFFMVIVFKATSSETVSGLISFFKNHNLFGMGCKNSKQVSKPKEEARRTTDEGSSHGKESKNDDDFDILMSDSSTNSRYVPNSEIPEMPSTSPLQKRRMRASLAKAHWTIWYHVLHI